MCILHLFALLSMVASTVDGGVGGASNKQANSTKIIPIWNEVGHLHSSLNANRRVNGFCVFFSRLTHAALTEKLHFMNKY